MSRRTSLPFVLRSIPLGLPLLLVAAALLLLAIRGASPVQADPHAGQSVNVVIIGGPTLDPTCVTYSTTDANMMTATLGGCLPLAGPIGELGDFTFAAMRPTLVNPSSLYPYDTAVLNMASYDMACNSANLPPLGQSALVSWVATGHKLIIYDSECSPGPDYSWLPYPFTTNNPGAMGQPGTLTIVEDNLLSTLIADPTCAGGDTHCIDVVDLGANTDAVGDMNVMTTYDPNWCLDMSGTNYNNVTGPVHTYAPYPSGTDVGLIIYNGLDQNYQIKTSDPNLRKIWVQELQQPFDPSGLPCIVRVVGINLDPDTDLNEVGTDHTVTATLTNLLGAPQPDILVTFEVTAGPNAGEVSDPNTGECTVNDDCTTDVNGQVSWTYTGSGGPGTDTIEARFVDAGGQTRTSNPVTKTWEVPPVPTLTVTKVVINDNGGLGTVAGFTLRIDGTPVTSGVPNLVTAGTHTVSEDPYFGYAATIGGDCDPDGTVTLALGEHKTCIITNDDLAGVGGIVDLRSDPSGSNATSYYIALATGLAAGAIALAAGARYARRRWLG